MDELSRLRLDYPVWAIAWETPQEQRLVAVYLVTGDILTAPSIPELRALLEDYRPPPAP
jgi:hypothetical protein